MIVLGVDVEELLRQKGNVAFQSKSFELACTFYSQAIEKDSENHVRTYTVSLCVYIVCVCTYVTTLTRLPLCHDPTLTFPMCSFSIATARRHCTTSSSSIAHCKTQRKPFNWRRNGPRCVLETPV